MSKEERIEALEAQLAIDRFLHRGDHEIYDKWERALRRYADDEWGPSLAREALGIREFWDNGALFNKRFLRLRRIWRRIVGFFR